MNLPFLGVTLITCQKIDAIRNECTKKTCRPEKRLEAYLEEIHSGATFEDAVLGFGLIGQLLGVRYRQVDLFDGEEGRQVGGVRRDDDESEEPPDAAHETRGQRLRIDIRALLHERAHGEPQAVPGRELVLNVVVILVAWMSAAPLVRREPGQNHHDQADQDVGDESVYPNLERKRIQKGEEAWLLARRYFIQDTYAQAYEGLGEVHHLLALEVDGEG